MPTPPQKNTYRRYSQAEKDEFFAVLERLECAAAAARELGFKAATCRKWARQAGTRLKYGVKGSEPRREYTQAQKDGFFTLLDRLGNVSAAASELGLSAAVCYAWVRETGALPKRERKTTGPNRKHTQAEKDEFFAVLEKVGSVTEAARQLGLSKDTCHNWARAAGIRSVRVTVGKRQEFFRLRAAGVGRREATAAVGVDRKTAYLWDNGIVQAKGKLVHPETAAVDYKQTVNTAIAATEATQGTTTASIAQTALEKVIDPRYLSLQDRERIRDMKAQGCSSRAVAAALGRSPSSISREISRNSHPVLGYQPYGAQRAAVARRPRPKVSKLNGNQRLRDFVKDKLLTRCSPEQISHLLIKEYPDDEQMRVSPETIYQALYLQARGGLKREVKDALRTGRTRRKTRKNTEERTSRFRDPMINISERPPEVEDRAVPGHWEGDLVRHEALFYRAEVEDLRRCAVAAA
ncbi:IS30 family transposase [Arthrobacter sp. NyZ413]|uniref:IS30 family transposase n=1 Tax=Arthrobacter sp. NyZ413 TaxID=3144669 RepID=UPI003BF7E638